MNDTYKDYNRKIESLIKAGDKRKLWQTMKVTYFPYFHGLYKVQAALEEGGYILNLYSKNLGKLVSEKWFDATAVCTDYQPLDENTYILLIEYGERADNVNMVNSQGRLVFKQWLNHIEETPYDNIFIIGKGGRWNLYDINKGLPLLDTWAYDIFNHRQKDYLMGIEQECGKCNVLNLKTGSFLFEGFYRSIIIYSNAIELQKNNQTYNLADINGNILYNQWFDAMELKRNGDDIEWLKVKLKKKVNYINSKGEYLLKKWADFGDCFCDGYLDGTVTIKYGNTEYRLNSDGVIYDSNSNKVELLSEGIVNNPQIKTYIAKQLGIDVDDISGISKMDNYFNNMYHVVEYRDPKAEEYVYNFINNRGDIIFKNIYFTEVYSWYNYYIIMFSDGKINLINKDCKLVFPFKSNSITKDTTKDGTKLISVENSDGQYGFFDINDAHQLGEWYDDLYEFASDRNVTPVKKNEKWNFLTTDGKYTLNNWFDSITLLSVGNRNDCDHYCVHYHNRVSFFGPQGLPFINMWFDSLGPYYRDNILSVKFKDKYNLLKFDTDNNSGELLLSTWYEKIQPTNIGNNVKGSVMAYVTEGDKNNLIDEDGNLLSKCDFDYISPLYHNIYDELYCIVSIGGGANTKWNFIDMYGNLIFEKWSTNKNEFVSLRSKIINTKLSELNESKKTIIKESRSDILNNAEKIIGVPLKFVRSDFFDVNFFNSAFILISENSDYFIVDNIGRPIINKRIMNIDESFGGKYLTLECYEWVTNTYESYYNIIDKDAKLLLPWCNSAHRYEDKNEEEVWEIGIRGKHNLVKNGRILSDIWFDRISSIDDNNNCSVVKDEKINMFNLDTNKLILPWVSSYRRFDSESYEITTTGQKKYIVNTEGRPLIKQWFEKIEYFHSTDDCFKMYYLVVLKGCYNLLEINRKEQTVRLLLDSYHPSIKNIFADYEKSELLAIVEYSDGGYNILKKDDTFLFDKPVGAIIDITGAGPNPLCLVSSFNETDDAKFIILDINGKPLTDWVDNTYFDKNFSDDVVKYRETGVWPTDKKLPKQVTNESVILNENNEKHKDKILQHFRNFLKTINAEVCNEDDLDITFYHFEDESLRGVQLSTFVTNSHYYSYFHNVIDGKGNLLFDNWYKSITDLSDYGMFLIRTFDERSNIYNFKDKSFFFKNPINYITWLFNDNFYIQNDDGKYNIINSKKEISSDVWFDDISCTTDYENLFSIIRVSVNNKYNLVNLRKSVHVVFDKWYDAIIITPNHTDGDNNLIKLIYNGMTNFALPDGRILSNIWFDAISIPEHGSGDYTYFKVTLKGRENMITQDGKLLFNKFHNEIGRMQNIGGKNYVCVKDVNKNDEIMVVDGDKSTSTGYSKLRFVFGGNNCYVIATKHETNRDLYRVLDSDLNAVSPWVEDMETIKRILNERGVVVH